MAWNTHRLVTKGLRPYWKNVLVTVYKIWAPLPKLVTSLVSQAGYGPEDSSHIYPTLMYQETYSDFSSKTLNTFINQIVFSSSSSYILIEKVACKYLLPREYFIVVFCRNFGKFKGGFLFAVNFFTGPMTLVWYEAKIRSQSCCPIKDLTSLQASVFHLYSKTNPGHKRYPIVHRLTLIGGFLHEKQHCCFLKLHSHTKYSKPRLM